jgi:hypothetical protein
MAPKHLEIDLEKGEASSGFLVQRIHKLWRRNHVTKPPRSRSQRWTRTAHHLPQEIGLKHQRRACVTRL